MSLQKNIIGFDMMSKLIDFHVHLDFYDNINKIIKQYEESNIITLFVTNLPEIFYKHYYKYNKLNKIRLALGYHPEMIENYKLNEELFVNLFEYTNYIGEIGLDFSDKNIKYKDEQIKAFDFIIKESSLNNKIYSIHSRKAEKEVLNILIKYNIKNAVFHWYSGNLQTLKEIINNNYYFSINYNMLKTKNGIKILNKIPLNKILFETDGPFSKYENKIISPENIENIYKLFNDFYKINNFKEIIYKNYKQLTGKENDN